MNDKRVHEDLSYVRAVLDRAEVGSSPSTVYFLWAVLTFFGFAIIDYRPEWTGAYWFFAGPLGGVASGILGARAGRGRGQESQREGWAQALHWSGLMATILLLIPLEMTDVLEAPDFPRLVLLIVAFAYFTAGAYLDRRLLPLSGVLAACYLFTVFQRELPYLWTLAAAVMAASLVAAGLFATARARRPGGP